MIELTVRLVASLAIVVGLLLLTVKVGGKRFQARGGAPVRVVHRQALSRGSAVAVVEVGSRILVLGTTEHQVSLLTELDEGDVAGPATDAPVLRLERTPAPEDFAPELAAAMSGAAAPIDATDEPVAEDTAPTRRRGAGAHAAPRAPRPSTRPSTRPSVPGATGGLNGSVLSPDTWRQAVAAVRGRS